MLRRNLNSFYKNTYVVEQIFERGIAALHQANVAPPESQMAVVLLQDSWAQFVRRLILSSACRHAVSANGNSIVNATPHSDFAAAETWLVRNRPNPKRDVGWHVSDEALRYGRRLRLSNLTEISAAIGSTTSPEREIRAYRNFIVHRCRETALLVKGDPVLSRYGLNSIEDIPAAFDVGGLRVFNSWTRRFRSVALVASNT